MAQTPPGAPLLEKARTLCEKVYEHDLLGLHPETKAALGDLQSLIEEIDRARKRLAFLGSLPPKWGPSR